MKQIDETLLKALKNVIEDVIDEKIKKYVSSQSIPTSYRGVVISVNNNEEDNTPINQYVNVVIEKLDISRFFPNHTSVLLTEGAIVEILCPGDNIQKGYISSTITS